jgi:cytochrome P450
MEPSALNSIEIAKPEYYAEHGYPHDAWAMLRRTAPVFRYERPGLDPFWAVTKHADIVEVSRQPELYRSDQALFITPKESQTPDVILHQLLNMNPPEHPEYRGVTSHRFTPRALRERLTARIEEIAAEVLDAVVDREECDFVTDLSARFPLAVIAEMFGAPRSDWDLLIRLSNELVGAGDPEYNRGENQNDALQRARMEFFEYFSGLIEDRRKHPHDDISTVLVNGQVDGSPMPAFELLSYFALLIVAGNETTRNATTGGLYAFINNPEQWERLKRDPSLARWAAEEVLRWTSPVIHFLRVATADTELHGQKIRKNDTLALYYPSANRDEEVFEDPYRFDIGRNPNPHIAFGIGEHFCLGANLARVELQVMLRQLSERLEQVELAGPISRLRANFIGGIKHMPIRYKMRPRKH